MGKKLAIGLGSALLVFLIVFCVVPLKQVSYAATGSYQAPEAYYVSEPYTVRIPYTVNEPQTIQVPYTVTEPYTVWQNIYDPITHEVIDREPVTKYREVVKYSTETVFGPVTKYREVTMYREVPKQTNVWEERPVTLYKNVSMLEYLIGY